MSALLVAPLVYADPAITDTVGASDVESLPGALAVSGVGVLGAFVALHLCNGLATAGGRVTAALLAVGSTTQRRDSAV